MSKITLLVLTLLISSLTFAKSFRATKGSSVAMEVKKVLPIGVYKGTGGCEVSITRNGNYFDVYLTKGDNEVEIQFDITKRYIDMKKGRKLSVRKEMKDGDEVNGSYTLTSTITFEKRGKRRVKVAGKAFRTLHDQGQERDSESKVSCTVTVK